MLKMRGIEEVIIYCTDNGAVMTAWGKEQGIGGSLISFMSDTTGAVTKALGMELVHPGPVGVLGSGRSKRFAMFVDHGVIKVHHVSENDVCGSEGCDPAGDAHPESSCAEFMMAAIDKVKTEL